MTSFGEMIACLKSKAIQQDVEHDTICTQVTTSVPMHTTPVRDIHKKRFTGGRVDAFVETTTFAGDYGDIAGVRVECCQCGHTTESYGIGDGSVKRCLALLYEECPRHMDNWYVANDSGDVTPLDSKCSRQHIFDDEPDSNDLIERELWLVHNGFKPMFFDSAQELINFITTGIW